MTCIKCNSSLLDGFLYCPFCGQKQKVHNEINLIQSLDEFSRGERVITQWGSAVILALVPAGEKIPPVSAALRGPDWVYKINPIRTYKQSYVSKKDRALMLPDQKLYGETMRYVHCVTLDELREVG